MINGSRKGQAVVTRDGSFATLQRRAEHRIPFTPNLDAFSETKALLSSPGRVDFQAGGTIQVSIRGGSKEHGTTYYFGRNEFFSANSYFDT